MATIHNPTIRIFHLPCFDGEQPPMLEGGGTIEISDKYLKRLRASKNSHGDATGWALRLEGKGAKWVVKSPIGVEGDFETRIKASRKSKSKSKGEQNRQRIEALENQAAAVSEPASD